MLTGFVNAYIAFGDEKHLKIAEKNANFLLHKIKKNDGGLFHSFKNGIATIDGETKRLAAGDVVVIPAGCPQQIRNDGEDDLVFLAICTPRFVPECYRDLEES